MFSKFWKRDKGERTRGDEGSTAEHTNWSFIGADMHSHLIPGIDDGAKTMEDSIALLRELEAMGFKRVVTTPHTMIDFYPNTSQIITSGLQLVRERLVEEQINIELSAASEYYIDEYFLELIEKEPLLTIRKNEVLVEFSMLYEPPFLHKAIFNLQTSGYKPIIAHPERYIFFHNNFDRYEELKDRGCYLQLNLLSLSGYYGRSIMQIAQKLLDKGMYDYCGTDMHHLKHAEALKNMLQSKVITQLMATPFLNSKLCF